MAKTKKYFFGYLTNCIYHAASLSYNVLGIRRFANPNKGFAKQRPGFAKCGCSEPWERSDLGERNPEPPNRRRSVYRLLCDVPHYSNFICFCILHFFIHFLLEFFCYNFVQLVLLTSGRV